MGAERKMVRIVDPNDEFNRRLGLVVDEDADRFGVWISGHDVGFVHWASRSVVEVVVGTWYEVPGKGEMFVADGKLN